MSMTVLGIIPARGGLQSIPRKNLVPVLGKPLIAYTIEAARQARRLTRMIVSTEDAEIAAVSREYGAPVPFMRPAELATPTARSLPVIQHALREMERLDATVYDAVVMLQPTAPLRTAADIDAAIERLESREADSVVSVVAVGGHHPARMKRILPDGRLINYLDHEEEDMRPRQELPPVYMRNGAIYLARRALLLEQGRMTGPRCYAYVMPPERSVNIDAEEDFAVVEYWLRRRTEVVPYAVS